MIAVQHLYRTYGDGPDLLHANRDISFRVSAGEFVVLAGPSGSGKTTLLNVIGGLDSASSGSVLIDDVEVTALSPRALAEFRRDRVGYVFQRSNLVASLSVYENAVLQLRLQKRLTRAARERTRALLDEVGLGSKLEALPAELSGGQQQRAAIVRAVTSETTLVVADEPTASLDSTNADGILQLMRRLNEDSGVTILVSSHDDRVIEAARRVIQLADGAIISDSEAAGGGSA
ncbi:ABC transporter ATP-binding protein [uncultured Microbacterium sp.]|uniref:ABC transporter ATP-binding protein n=1 Tax=uncultured Microbacterium sp. TaxID=191216 RepID=UPI0025FD3A1F|nr:ABC transporter ATP-binding protein [uncultured Microbacterium sp.]